MFREIGAKGLRCFSVWLPMMDGDSAESAREEAEDFLDDRGEHYWDPEGRLGELFAKKLKLKGAAWDVYLLYPPGVTWGTDEPPEPAFWTHQLPPAAGADGKRLLNPGKFFYELMKLLGKGDTRAAWALAHLLHLKGLGAVRRQRAQSSPEDVLAAFEPAAGGIRRDEQ